MWQRPINRNFRNTFHTEPHGSGKWLVPIDLGDPLGLWPQIVEKVEANKFADAKMSSPRLDEILGHHLVCVYCLDSHADTVEAALKELRDIGVDGVISYKTDLATWQDRNDKLYISSDFENHPRP